MRWFHSSTGYRRERVCSVARTGENENKQANAQLAADQNQSFQTGQAAVGKFNKNLDILGRGGMIAPDPWKGPEYLATQNPVDRERHIGRERCRSQSYP
jgi:hypothetical protein